MKRDEFKKLKILMYWFRYLFVVVALNIFQKNNFYHCSYLTTV